MGIANDGSIFKVLQSFKFIIEIPELAIKIPPTIDISVRRLGLKNPERNPAQRYILPCHKNKTTAAIAIPKPYVDASTIDVTKSRVALVNK